MPRLTVLRCTWFPTPAGVKLAVFDNGCGFTPSLEATAKSTGMGLTGMQAQSKLLNAELETQLAPGWGTQATLLLPA